MFLRFYTHSLQTRWMVNIRAAKRNKHGHTLTWLAFCCVQVVSLCVKTFFLRRGANISTAPSTVRVVDVMGQFLARRKVVQPSPYKWCTQARQEPRQATWVGPYAPSPSLQPSTGCPHPLGGRGLSDLGVPSTPSRRAWVHHRNVNKKARELYFVSLCSASRPAEFWCSRRWLHSRLCHQCLCCCTAVLSNFLASACNKLLFRSFGFLPLWRMQNLAPQVEKVGNCCPTNGPEKIRMFINFGTMEITVVVVMTHVRPFLKTQRAAVPHKENQTENEASALAIQTAMTSF